MPKPTRRNTTAHLNGYEWWLSKTGKDGSQRYPERICVGGRDDPRMYYPVDRGALLKLADEMEQRQRDAATAATDGVVDAWCLREYADCIRAILKEANDAEA